MAHAWISDQGDGTFVNPILYADYSDPDVIRVGEDFYMTSSSFSHVPGLPILHSKDLVNWKLINHALPRMPLPGYDKPQHGNGVWAPSLRYRDGRFMIYYGDPDYGIFMLETDDPAGPWSEPLCIREGKGLIDTCPFWDDDGQAYLIHAYAKSRAGIKHRLNVCRMSPDGKQLLDEGVVVFDGERDHPTLEGPKLYKRNGYYYVFAPAGGVATGWQTVLRSRNVYGPYDDRIVMHQGSTEVNGPHQGGWVELESGESWFVHFQDKGPFGRIVHLQPVQWVDDWPVIGVDTEGRGRGEPVQRYRKPDVGRTHPMVVPDDGDEFDEPRLGLQWQWQANPSDDWYSLTDRAGRLRLFAAAEGETLYMRPNLLLQKLPGPNIEVTAKLEGHGLAVGNRSGLIVFGYQYAALELRVAESDEGDRRWYLTYAEGDKELESVETVCESAGDRVWLRVRIDAEARCRFDFSLDGERYRAIDLPAFQAVEGHWVGAKIGVFADRGTGAADANGYADVDSFRVEKCGGAAE
ncbi:glycoside hydrolase 43 family protein [Paenibacillus sp. TRM 82003]|nr:glycoside hydrolase 43 family protein [Paenibacillus sp. TRM 82003]